MGGGGEIMGDTERAIRYEIAGNHGNIGVWLRLPGGFYDLCLFTNDAGSDYVNLI